MRPMVAHFEDASKPVLGEITNLENVEFGRHMAEVELVDHDVVHDDRWLRGLVEGGGEQFLSLRIEGCVRCQRRPVEVERHHQRKTLALRDLTFSLGPWVREL